MSRQLVVHSWIKSRHRRVQLRYQLRYKKNPYHHRLSLFKTFDPTSLVSRRPKRLFDLYGELVRRRIRTRYGKGPCGPVFSTYQRPMQPGLHSLVPFQNIFDLFMSCLLNRLLLKTKDRTHSETFGFRKTLHNLERTFKDRKFSTENPILTFDFLTGVVEEGHMLDICKCLFIVLVPHLLSLSASDYYCAAVNGSRS